MDIDKIKTYLKELIAYRDRHFNMDDLNEIEDRNAFAEESECILDLCDSIDTECKEYNEKYIRLLADFDNYRKRSSAEMAQQCEKAKIKLLEAILPNIDNFEKVCNSLETSHSEDKFEDGMHIAYDALMNSLKQIGCEKIDCNLGDEFDYKIHDAIGVIPSQYENGHVAGIAASGWKLDGKTIIPVKVMVASGQENLV